jgi:Mg-chelatase subunit ChlD
MDITFLTPLAALFALTALVPVGVFLVRQRRMGAMRSALGLEEPTRGSRLPLLLVLAAVPVLLGIAASQPVIETTRVRPERTDAQVFVVLDTSRSMLASASAGEPTRFERARRVAQEVRDRLPEVPVGIASFTAGVLPHLFPTTNRGAFEATVNKAVGVGRTPTSGFFLTLATNLNALVDVRTLNYFPSSAQKRVLVVLTDGESQPPGSGLTAAFRRQPRIQAIFVRFWGADERIYETGVAEGGYEPDSKSAALLARFASATGGRVFSEDQAGEVAAAVREALGAGETVKRKQEAGRLALMPYITLAALVPLGLILLQRNIWWSWGPSFSPGVGRVPEGAKVSEPRGVAQPG